MTSRFGWTDSQLALVEPSNPKGKSHDVSDEARDESGRWTAGGGGGKKVKAAAKKDPAEGRPTKPEERHKGKTPPVLSMRAPPWPTGKKGDRKAGGFTATGHTNTKLGDLAEESLSVLDLRSILPVGVSGKTKRQNPLDREYDHSGWAFEIKAVTRQAMEYKAKPKKKEMESKRAYAKKHRLRAGTMIAVVDLAKGEVHAYWREGIGAFALTPSNLSMWNYAGTAKLKNPESVKKLLEPFVAK